jgi:uncharacterized membrane protein
MRTPTALAAALALTLVPAVANAHTVVDVGTLGGRWASLSGMNQHSLAVGCSETSDESMLAFTWTPETGMRPLPLPPDANGSCAYGVNDAGVVVGMVLPFAGESRAVLWDGDTIVELGPGVAIGINARNQVVGHRGAGQSWIWDAELGLHELPGPPNAVAYWVNDSGRIVGAVPLDDGVSDVPLVWDVSGGTIELWRLPLNGRLLAGGLDAAGAVPFNWWSEAREEWSAHVWRDGTLTDIEALGPGGTIAVGLSDDGALVGNSGPASGGRPFLYAGGVMTELGGLAADSFPEAVNGRHQVAGTFSSAPDARDLFFWDAGAVERLQCPTSFCYVLGLNDRGDFRGHYETDDKSWPRGFVALAGPHPPPTLANLIARVEALESAGTIARNSGLREVLGAAERAGSSCASRRTIAAFAHQLDALMRSGAIASAVGADLRALADRVAEGFACR